MTHSAPRSHRHTLLASTVFVGGALVASLGVSQPVSAACSTSTTAGTTTLLCAQDTTTTNATNNNGSNPSTSAYQQSFNANIVGQVNAGVVVDGLGFKIFPTGAAHTLTFNNSGAITATAANADVSALYLIGNGGLVTYTGNGSISNALANSTGLFILNNGAINIGAAGAPVTGNFTASGISLGTFSFAGPQNIFLHGGSVTVNDSFKLGLVFQGEGTVNLTTTGQTVITQAPSMAGNIGISMTGAAMSVVTDATVGAIGSRFGIGLQLNTIGNAGAANATIGGNIFAVSGVVYTDNSATNTTGALALNIAATGAINASGNAVRIARTVTAGQIADTITNAGSIVGNRGILVSAATPLNVINSGTIIGNGGTAIQFGNAINSLTLLAGSAITGNVLGGTGIDTLRLGGTASAIFDVSQLGDAAQYRGFEQFEKIDTSIWTLTGTSTYTGTVAVNAGALIVNGSIATSSNVTVASGSTLMGTGTLSSTFINSGATLAPGNIGTPGSLAVSGNLTLASGANYVVQAAPANIAAVHVSGGATLNGTVQVTFAPGVYAPGSYSIVTASSIVGTFSGLTMLGSLTAPGVKNPHLAYFATHVDLVLDPSSLAAMLPAGASINVQNVAQAVDRFINNGGTLPAAFNGLFGLSPSGLSGALTQLSGEPGANGGVIASQQLMGSFLSLMINPFTQPNDGTSIGPALGYAAEAKLSPEAASAYGAINKAAAATPSDTRYATWASVFGGQSKANGDVIVGSIDTTARTWGLAAGLNYRVSPDALIGIAIAGGNTNWSLNNALGSGKSDAFQIGLYGTKRFGANYVSAAVAYAWHQMTTDRTVAVAGIDRLTAAFNAHNIGTRIEAGRRIFEHQTVSITPYAALQAQSFHLPAYGETATLGSNQFALAYTSRTATAMRAEAGTWFESRLPAGNVGQARLFGRVAFAHDWRSDASVTAAFQTLAGSSFIVNGATPPKNLALVVLGSEIRLTDRIAVAGKFDGEIAGGYHSYAGTGTIRVNW